MGIKNMSRILVVEDEDGLSGAIQEWLQDEHYVVTVASDGLEALKKLRHDSFDFGIVILLHVIQHPRFS